MIFSCTKKVIDQIKKIKEVESEKPEPGLHNWYIDALVLERKKYLLFTNAETLFSFFVYAGTKKEIQNLEQIFADKLKEMIIRQIGTSEKYFKHLFPVETSYRYTKTNSRSVLGSMNDFKYQIKAQIAHRGPLQQNYDLINHALNVIPMGGIKYMQPGKKMKLALESANDES